MSKKSSHIPVIDSFRGLAASLVCFYHFVYTTIDYIQTDWILEIFHHGKRGVQLFFIISGIVIPLSLIKSKYKLNNWWPFIMKRFIRIEPPYLAAILVGIIYLIVRNYIPGSASIDLTPSLLEIILHLGYLIPFFEETNWINPVFWTLAVEFQYYLVLSLIFPMAISGKVTFRLVFYSIMIGLGFIGASNSFFPYWAPYFLVGIIYILYKSEKIKIIEFSILATVMSPILLYKYGIIDYGIAAITILIIHFLPTLKSNLMMFLGKISYSLYLLHSILGAAFINFMSHRFTEPYQKFLVISTGFLISVLSAYLFYVFIEKPSHKYARKIKQS